VRAAFLPRRCFVPRSGTLRHFVWRESQATTFFSLCANDAGENVTTKRKCSACAVQVLVNTACLRAFCFCVLIGTNALESFNGSISAMVSKRSDFYISHVGRAQLALLKRCFPGGYGNVVDRLRQACRLAPLTERAKMDTRKHQRKANHLYGAATTLSSDEVRKASDKKLLHKARRSAKQTADGKLLKTANEARCAALEQKNLRAEEGEGAGADTDGDGSAAGKKRTRDKGGSPDGLLLYDRSGSSSSKNLQESMVRPSAPKKARNKST